MNARADLLLALSYYDSEQRNSKVAEMNALEALSICEKFRGKTDKKTVECKSVLLGVILMDQGRYEESEQMLEQILRSRETVLGKEHPKTMGSINNLALVLAKLGKHEKAHDLRKETLKLKIENIREGGSFHTDKYGKLS